MAQSTGYGYDASGNRTSVTNQISLTSVSAFSFEPRRVLAGDRVNIYGRNFPAGNNAGAGVSFNGVAATIVSVSTRVITVVVPAGVASGAVAVSVLGGLPMTVGTIEVEGLSVAPSQVAVAYGQQQQFTVGVTGSGSSAVTWAVNGVAGGSATFGTITPAGLYTAPQGSTTADYPFIVRATHAQLGISAYAVVTSSCASSFAMPDSTLVSGALTPGFDRECWQFSAQAGERLYVAYIGGPSLRSLTVRGANNLVIASGVPGAVSKIPNVVIPSTGNYRIEVEGTAASSGSYQLWSRKTGILANGIWQWPISGSWHDPTNWSNGVLPTSTDAVVIGTFKSPLTVTVSSGSACLSLLSSQAVTLTSGTLSVTTTAQVNAAFTINGGTLAGATVLTGTDVQSTLTITSDLNNRLSGVTLNGNVALGTSARLRIANGLTLNGTMTLSGDFASVGFEGSQTVQAGTFAFTDATANPGFWPGLGMTVSGTVTFAAGTVIQGGYGRIGSSSGFNNGAMTLVNQGMINANTSGRTLEVSTSVFTNTGTAQATGGGTLNVIASSWTNNGTLSETSSTLVLGGTWTNAGTITATNGTVNFGGTFTTSSIVTITNMGAAVSFTGTLNNTGATISLAGVGGSYALSGGTITGGTVTMTGGADFGITTDVNNRLSGVTLNGNVTLGTSARLRIANGLTLNGTMTLSGDFASVGFEGSQTVQAGTFAFTNATANPGFWPGLGMQVSGTATFAAGTVIQGGYGRIGSSSGFNNGAMTLVNQGMINANTSGRTLEVSTSVFTNTGTAQATGGGTLNVIASSWTNNGTLSETSSTLVLGGTWTNAGTITATNGTVNFGGTFTTSSIVTITNTGAAVSFTGTLNNTGATISLAGVGGSYALSGGTITGGTVTMTGGADFGITTDVNNRLSGVTLNGNVTLGTSARLRIANGLTLNGTMTLSGDFASVGFEGSQTVQAGTFAFTNATANPGFWPGLGMTVSGTVTFAAGTVIQGGYGRIGSSSGFNNGAMTLVNQGMINANTSGRTLEVSTSVFTNTGTAQATGGGTLNVIASSWTNNGTLSETSSTLVLGGTWTNAGTITATNGTVNFGGTFTTSSIVTITNTGAAVSFTGTLNNTGATISLAGVGGSYALSGGTITGGTVTMTGGADFGITTDVNNRLSGVTLNGNVTLGTSARLRIANGLTLNGTMTLSGDFASVGFEGSQTVQAGTFAFTNATANPGFWPGLGMQVSGTATFAAGTVIQGGYGRIGSSSGFNNGAMTLVNQGMINANTSGRTLEVSTSVFTNTGTAQATGGGTLNVIASSWTNNGTLSETSSTLVLGGTWTNAGTITATNGTVNFGGTFTTSSIVTITNTGAAVSFTGTLNNTGATISLAGVGGSYALSGGTITGGTVTMTGGADFGITTDVNNRLSGVTLNGNVTLGTSARLRIANGLTLNGTMTLSGDFASVGFEGSQTVQAGTFAFTNATANPGFWPGLGMQVSGTATFAAGTVIQGGYGRIGSSSGFNNGAMTLVNQGMINANTSGRTLEVSTSVFTNTGTAQATGGGTLSISGGQTVGGAVNVGSGSIVSCGGVTTIAAGGTVTMGGGTLSASSGLTVLGTINGVGTINAAVTNSGVMSPGSPVGTLTIGGAYTQSASGILNIELGGTAAGASDKLMITGAAVLGGTINVSLVNGYLPVVGNSLSVITFSSRMGTFATSNLPTVGPGVTLQVTYGATTVNIDAI